MSRIPVIILGGFLGAGKTTALNDLLRRAGPGTMVLVNDFGAIDIDGSLIAGQDGDVLSLANGCVCCSIGPDFSATLGRVLARDPPPARILIEASGVSDPWRVAQLVKLERATRIAAVVVLADALTFADQSIDRWLADTLARQIARADVVALTKCDSAEENVKAAARAAVAAIRPEVPIIEIVHGRLPDVIMEMDSDSRADEVRFLADVPEHGFRSWHWLPRRGLDRDRLKAALDGLPPAVLRGKGIIRLAPDMRRHVLQIVGRRWSLEPWDGPEVEDALVVIGTEGLPDAGSLEAWFSRALAEDAKDSGRRDPDTSN